MCTGGGGRFLIFQLPKARKLAVVDVAEARVVRQLDMPADEIVFAAGIDRLVLGLPTQKLLLRYSLTALKKDQTVALPDDGDVVALVREDLRHFRHRLSFLFVRFSSSSSSSKKHSGVEVQAAGVTGSSVEIA